MIGHEWLAAHAVAAADCLKLAGRLGVNFPVHHDEHRLLVERAEQHTRLAQLPVEVAEHAIAIEEQRLLEQHR